MASRLRHQRLKFNMNYMNVCMNYLMKNTLRIRKVTRLVLMSALCQMRPLSCMSSPQAKLLPACRLSTNIALGMSWSGYFGFCCCSNVALHAPHREAGEEPDWFAYMLAGTFLLFLLMAFWMGRLTRDPER